MRIGPRYGGEPVLVLDASDPGAVLEPLLRQRRRLGGALAALAPEEWAAQSRCAEWSNRDVVVHLAITNRFWATSAEHARKGEPTRMLEAFDPAADPPRHVARAGKLTDGDALSMLRETTDALERALHGATAEEWDLPAESPLGHVALSLAAHHALWDGWVHERDIAADVDMVPPVVDDEVEHALRFVSGFGPALLALRGLTELREQGTVESVEPDLGFSVLASSTQVRVTEHAEPGVPLVLRGPAVDLLEGLSLRTPLDLGPSQRWLTAGLADTFDEPRHDAGE